MFPINKNAVSIVAVLALPLAAATGGLQHETDPFDGSGIQISRVQRDLAFLAGDALQGRATGSPGAQRAARFLARDLEAIGLVPAAADGYYQAIPMHGSQPLSDSQLRLFDGDKVVDLELSRDYHLLTAGAQTFVVTPAPLVFVGYGIIAPEFDYNDYQSIDAAGKIVVFLGGEPKSDDPSYFAGSAQSIYSYPESKQRLAISRGAIGSILIPSPRIRRQNWSLYQRELAFEDVKLAYSVTDHLAILINHAAAHSIFAGAKFRLEDVFAMDRSDGMRSFPMTTSISFQGEFIERDFISSNVIAKLPGRDTKLSDSYVLLSAHYDHLGRGPAIAGDDIYNGALDNAIGVAALLEIARVFAEAPTRPLRSVLFVFLTGEEKGLLGSRYYVDHPVVPLYKTIANINIDGMGTLDRFHDVVGIGAEMSTLGDDLAAVAEQQGLAVTEIPAQFRQEESFERSDQIAFAQAGIPAVMVMNGMQFESFSREEGIRRLQAWFEQIYHSPFDDLNQDMDFGAVRQHMQVILSLASRLANKKTAPAWHPGIYYANTRLQTQAERR